MPNWAHNIGTSRHFFTGDFLSSAWRLPQLADLGELSGIAQKRARTLPLPPALFQTSASGKVCVGTCEHAATVQPFVLPSGFFGHHTFLGGKSGEGKSTMMVHLVRGVVAEGQRGLFLLDPHGDLAEDALRVIPAERVADVVWIDLAHPDESVGFNPLDVTLGRDRDLVVASLIAVFSHIWKGAWGPRMEAPFRAAILTLLEANRTLVERDPKAGPDQQYTLLDILQVLTDESFCTALLDMTSDLFVHRFWHEYYNPLSLIQQRDRIDPVLTKVLQFESQVARRILGQSRSTIRLHELTCQQKVIIIRLAFAEVGRQTGSVIGSTLLGLFMVTLREQSRLAIEERKKMVLFLDEFQTFGAGADLAQLLAELRKYGGSAVLATQSLDYLTAIDPSLLPTILANTKQYFLFRLSASDADTMAQELDIAPADLVNLDSYTCYVRLVFAGQQQPTFSVRLDLPLLGPQALAAEIRQKCQQTYCRPATLVEEHLVAAMAKAIAASSHRPRPEISAPQQTGDQQLANQQHGTMFAKTRRRRRRETEQNYVEVMAGEEEEKC